MSEAGANVVVIEDEDQIRRFVRIALESEGYRVHEAATAQRGLAEAGSAKPDLVILDLGLPDGDGAGIIRDIRSWSAMPIIVLSARATDSDKIAALDDGADDYVTKPFSAGELLARVRAQLRRHAAGPADASAPITFGDMTVDFAARSLTRGGERIPLTPIEWRLLALLAGNAGKVLTHRQILREVWGPQSVERSHYLRVYVRGLRQKIEADTARPRHLLTETGVGYRFVL